MKDRLWYYTMLLFTALILTYDLQKSPLVLFMVGMIMLKILIQVKLNKAWMINISLISFFILLLGYVLLSENFTLEVLFSYNTGIFGRVFLSGIAGLFHSFDLFPEQIDYIGFSSISTYVSDFFDLEHHERSARLIMEAINPRGVKEGVAGVINSLFIAEAWANFGLIGVILGPTYVGFLIGITYYFLLLTKKTPLFLGLFGYLSYKSSILGGFNDYIYNVGIAVIVIMILGIVIVARKLYYYKNDPAPST